MATPPEDPPNEHRFDEFAEIAVDGKPVFRIEQISDLKLSDIDDTVIAFFAKALGEEVETELKDEYDKGVEDIIQEEEPNVMIYQSGDDSWTDLFEEV